MLKKEEIQSTPFPDQKPGTSGLRKPTKHFFQKNYIENFVQAILNSEGGDIFGSTLVVGGDGRYGTVSAINTIISIAAANGVILKFNCESIQHSAFFLCVLNPFGFLWI